MGYHILMKLKIKYIGNDEKYWDTLKSRFERDFSQFSAEFNTQVVDEKFSPKDEFIDICNSDSNIVYIDFTVEPSKILKLAKLLCRNNETRRISVVGLYSYTDDFDSSIISRAIAASIRINHFKCAEITDVVSNPIYMLDANLIDSATSVLSKKIDKFNVRLPIRVGYIDNRCFHIETNSYLKVGDIVDISTHPLKEIMPSTKVFVEKFYESNLYYNCRYAYDLEFIYIDNDFFSATNKNWILFKKLKNGELEFEDLNKHDQDQIFSDMEKRKEVFQPIQDSIQKWIDDNDQDEIKKRLKILIIDKTLSIFKELDGINEDFAYSVNFQTMLMKDLYQIQRSLPHLIIYRLDNENNDFHMLEKIRDKIVSMKEFNPYPFILVFNSSDETSKLRDKLNYENCISYAGDVHLDEIKKMAKILDDKKHITDTQDRVYLKLRDPMSLIYIKKNFNVIAMTESNLYFESKLEIPMWTVFIVDAPIKMLFTVIPHEDSGKFKTEKNVYRAMINGVGEMQKAQIRRMINKSFMVN